MRERNSAAHEKHQPAIVMYTNDVTGGPLTSMTKHTGINTGMAQQPAGKMASLDVPVSNARLHLTTHMNRTSSVDTQTRQTHKSPELGGLSACRAHLRLLEI